MPTTERKKRAARFNASAAFAATTSLIAELRATIDRQQRTIDNMDGQLRSLTAGYVRHVRETHTGLEARLTFVERHEAHRYG